LATCAVGTEIDLTWRYVIAELGKAAAGADVTDIAIALSLALEKIEYRPK